MNNFLKDNYEMPLVFDSISGGSVATETLKIGEVVATIDDQLDADSKFLKISAQFYNLTKTDYPQLHFHITNDSVDEVFTVQQLIIGNLNVYIKVL